MRHFAIFFLILSIYANQSDAFAPIVTPKSLSYNVASGTFNVGPTQYVTDDPGNVLAVWSVFNGHHTVLQAAFKPINGEWQIPGDPRIATQVISPFFFSVIDWTVAMDREGNAVVIWRVNNGTNTVVQAIFRPVNGSFTIAGDPRFEANYLNAYPFSVGTLPQVGIGKGNTTILWTIFNGFNTVIQASIGFPDGSFTRPGLPTIQTNILNYLSFQRGRFNITTTPFFFVDKDGNAIASWQIFNTTALVVQAVIRLVGGPFEISGNPQFQDNILSPRLFSISSLEFATIGEGNAAVLWKRNDQVTGNLILQAAFRPIGCPWEKPPIN